MVSARRKASLGKSTQTAASGLDRFECKPPTFPVKGCLWECSHARAIDGNGTRAKCFDRRPLIVRHLPTEVLLGCRQQADDWMTNTGQKPRSVAGGVVVVAIWIVVVMALLWWLNARFDR